MKAGISSSMLLAALLASMLLFGCSFEQAYREVNGVSFPVNSSGQTYGSASSANVPDDLGAPSDKVRDELLGCYPDLILTTTADGKEGYMYKEDFLPELAPSPEEAASGAYSTSPGDRLVYESDGKTVLGRR